MRVNRERSPKSAPTDVEAMTHNKCKAGMINLQEVFRAEKNGFKELLQEVLQEVLEQEMTDALGEEKGERSPGRLGYRSGSPHHGLDQGPHRTKYLTKRSQHGFDQAVIPLPRR